MVDSLDLDDADKPDLDADSPVVDNLAEDGPGIVEPGLDVLVEAVHGKVDFAGLHLDVLGSQH